MVTVGMADLPADVRRAIDAWRALPEAERTARLRARVVDEVVGNMAMEGQPPSPEWTRQAKGHSGE